MRRPCPAIPLRFLEHGCELASSRRIGERAQQAEGLEPSLQELESGGAGREDPKCSALGARKHAQQRKSRPIPQALAGDDKIELVVAQ